MNEIRKISHIFLSENCQLSQPKNSSILHRNVNLIHLEGFYSPIRCTVEWLMSVACRMSVIGSSLRASSSVKYSILSLSILGNTLTYL